jgi:hypothetical protein
MHRKNHEEKMLSQFYLKHGRMPVHDDGFYIFGSEEDHRYQMASMINRNKTEISDVKNKSELSEKVEKEEVENEGFINIKDIPNETPEDIYLRLDRAKEDEEECKRPLESIKIQMQRFQHPQVDEDGKFFLSTIKVGEDNKTIENTEKQQQRKYSITSTNKAYDGDSLEMFDHTNVFSSRVSVF